MRIIAGNLLSILTVLCVNHFVNSKIFERCELAKLLRYTHGLSEHEVAHWVCIAQYQSGLNSSLQTGTLDNGAHGLFQISDVFWCSPPNKGWACGVTCDRLRDDDLADDLACVRQIYEEHARISGDGYNAWTTYQPYCRGNAHTLIEGCFADDLTNYNFTEQYPKPYINDISNAISDYLPPTAIQKEKIYDRCELAQELRYRHKVPMEQIATWVCIAHHESRFNTAAIGRLNADGSLDHGLFQISDIYWCSPPGKGWACRVSCDKLEDTDITDDVQCIKTIYAEHERISGDGFTAWSVYEPYCQGRSDQFIEGCFDEGNDNSLDPYLPSESISTPTQSYTKAKKKTGKVYTPCELADELKHKHRIPQEHIATWVCIAKHESNFNTSAVGTGDHGIFQISDIYWCSPPGKGWACGLSCADLEDDDITDDVQCIRKIFDEHQRLSGDGFNAWVVYPNYCSHGRAEKYIEECRAPTQRPTTPHTLPFRPAITAPTRRPSFDNHHHHTNRFDITTKRPFGFNSFGYTTTKFPTNRFSIGNNQKPTKSHFNNFNSGFSNYHSGPKNPFAFTFGNYHAASNTENTVISTIAPSASIKTTTNRPLQNQNAFNFETKTTGKTTSKPKQYFNEPTIKTTTSSTKRIPETTTRTTPRPTTTRTTTRKTTTTLRTTKSPTTTVKPTIKTTKGTTSIRSLTTRKPITKSSSKPNTTTTRQTTRSPRITTKATTSRPTTRTTRISTTKRSTTPIPQYTTSRFLTTKKPVVSTTARPATSRVTTTTRRTATTKTSLQGSSSTTKKSVFDLYSGFINSSKQFKKEKATSNTALRMASTTATTRRTTTSPRTTSKTLVSSPQSNTRTTKSPTTTTTQRRGFRFGIAYTSTTSKPFGNSGSTTKTKSPFTSITTKSPITPKFSQGSSLNTFGKSTTLSPFTVFSTKSLLSSTPRQTKPLTTKSPQVTSRKPRQALFSFLSAPLPLEESSTASSTKSWFDEIFDRFKH